MDSIGTDPDPRLGSSLTSESNDMRAKEKLEAIHGPVKAVDRMLYYAPVSHPRSNGHVDMISEAAVTEALPARMQSLFMLLPA